jgi:hypothetical protein
MPNQVDGGLVRAMSGTELSRVRTEFRLRPPEPINQSLLESRGADIVMQSSKALIQMSGNPTNHPSGIGLSKGKRLPRQAFQISHFAQTD